ncbi:hypothetical protein LCGC14_1375350 [marine sediment metagenome]|uniref:Uncharacterized protein n=1 Tax=marine sediment metagenome TaxID=412755 RepID=A0A0F9N676_9ZZZZ
MATGQNLIDEVRRIIHDESATFRWADAELIDYLNAGQRAIVVLVPEANLVETVVDLTTSRIARQSIPSGGIKFIKATQNYANDGTTPQGTIRYAEKDALDTYEPTWEYVSTKADDANYFEHFCHDKREPKIYYVYPAPPTDGKRLGILYSANPTELTAVGSTIALSDEYTESLIAYVTYRALTKESRESMPDTFGQELYNQFLAVLGIKRAVESSVSASEVAAPEGD